MNRISKRKSVQKNYAFTIGERCIKWEGYPYNSSIRTIVKQTKVYWILDDGSKYKKSDYNLSGFVGYSDAFIEPMTEESLKAVCCRDMMMSIQDYLYEHLRDYDTFRAVYDFLGLQDKEHKLSIFLIDRYQRTGSFEYTEEG